MNNSNYSRLVFCLYSINLIQVRQEHVFHGAFHIAVHDYRFQPKRNLQCKKYVDLLKQVKRKTTEMIREPKLLSCEERLRELVLFSLEKGKLLADLIAASRYLKGTIKKIRDFLLGYVVIGQMIIALS